MNGDHQRRKGRERYRRRIELLRTDWNWCQAIRPNGFQCRRWAAECDGKYCWQHEGRETAQNKAVRREIKRGGLDA